MIFFLLGWICYIRWSLSISHPVSEPVLSFFFGLLHVGETERSNKHIFTPVVVNAWKNASKPRYLKLRNFHIVSSSHVFIVFYYFGFPPHKSSGECFGYWAQCCKPWWVGRSTILLPLDTLVIKHGYWKSSIKWWIFHCHVGRITQGYVLSLLSLYGELRWVDGSSGLPFAQNWKSMEIQQKTYHVGIMGNISHFIAS